MLKAAAAKAYQTGLALIVGAAFVVSPLLAGARTAAEQEPQAGVSADVVALSDLPREGRATYALILSGGPSPMTRTARSLATASASYRASSAAITGNTRCARLARVTVERGASSAAAACPSSPTPAITPATTTAAFARSLNDPDHVAGPVASPPCGARRREQRRGRVLSTARGCRRRSACPRRPHPR